MVLLYKSKKRKKNIWKKSIRLSVLFIHLITTSFVKFISNPFKFKKYKFSIKKNNLKAHYKNSSFFQSKFYTIFQSKTFWLAITISLFIILGIAFKNHFSNPVNLHNFYSNKGYHAEGLVSWYQIEEPLEKVHKRLFFNAPKEYLFANLRKDKLPDININIDFESLEELKKQRENALSLGVYDNSEAQYVKATLNYNGQNTKVKLKLKGWMPDHWSHENKWSLKIKTRGKDRFMGMSRFDIQHPRTREYQYEKMVLSTAKSMDLLATRLFFANVYINGESIGVMNIEEDFAKEFVESSSKKEGIFARLKFLSVTPHIWFEAGSNEMSILINSFSRTKVMGVKNRNLDKLFFRNLENTANSLFRGVMQGDLKPHDIFDIEQMGKYLAFVNFLNSHHGLAVPNQTYYFNPVTYKLEPIVSETISTWGGTEQHLWDKIKNEDGNGFELWNLIKSDELIYKAFRESMDDIFAKIQNDSFINKKEIKEDFYVLKKEFLFLPPVNIESMQRKFINKTYPLIQNEEFPHYQEGAKKYKALIHSKEDAKKEIATIALSNLVWDNNSPYLEITNLLPEDIIIEEINIIKSTNSLENELKNFPRSSYEKMLLFSKNLKEEAKISPDKTLKSFTNYSNVKLPITIRPTTIHGKPKIVSVPLKDIKKEDNLLIFGKAKRTLEKTEHIFYSHLYDYVPIAKEHPIATQEIKNILAKNTFLTFDKKNNILTVRPGKWRVNNFIITPYKTSLKIPPASKLIFDKEAGFLVRGNLFIEGKLDDKVVLEPLNKDDGWRGITVLKSNFYSKDSKGNFARSFIKNAIIKDTNFAKHNSWEVTGAVTFYESDVDIVNTNFAGTIAEDEINIVRSKFTMDNVKFLNSRSDAFDSDFSQGKVTNTVFENIGGDALDFSGSDVSANKVFFEKVKDKAVSVGEASKFSGTNLTIKSSGTGVASKDGSDTTISNSNFIDINHAVLMAYIKKNEYGGAKIVANDIKYKIKENDIVAQKGSSIELNGKSIKTRKVNVDKLYKEGYMKK